MRVDMLRLTSSTCILFSVFRTVLKKAVESVFPKSPLSSWLLPTDSKFKKKAQEQAENSSECVLSCVLHARADLVLYVSWYGWEAIKERDCCRMYIHSAERKLKLCGGLYKLHRPQFIWYIKVLTLVHLCCIQYTVTFICASDILINILINVCDSLGVYARYLSHRLNTSCAPHLSLCCSGLTQANRPHQTR